MGDDFDTLLAPQQGIPETLSAGEMGHLLGIGERTVRNLAGQGIVVKSAKGAYDTRATIRAYCAHLREHAAGRSGSATLTDERTRLAREQADKVALANAAARRELLPARQVESTWAGILRDVRARLLAVPSRCGAALSHLTAPDVAAIDREIRDALTEIAG